MKKFRFISLLIVLVYCLSVFSTVAFADESQDGVQQDTQNTTVSESLSGKSDYTYAEYMAMHADKNTDVDEFVVEGGSASKTEGEAEVITEIGGKTGSFIKTGESGFVEWTINVPKDGLYNVYISYYAVEGKSSDVERMFYVDGVLPFNESGSILMPRIWKNAGEIEQDARGNDKNPAQVEEYRWETIVFRDAAGYYDAMRFYLTAGEHTIRLQTVKEPVIIGEIKFAEIETLPTYAEYLNSYKNQGYSEVTGVENIKIQAELADFKSASVLSPTYDRSTPSMEPYDGAKLRLNALGEGKFKSANMWTEYVVNNVPKSGLYMLTFKAKQVTSRGLNIYRRIYVNGEVPFAEADALTFPYSSTYKNVTLGDGTTPYYIYLNEGTNVIRVESCLGSLSEIAREVDKHLADLNEAYRRIIVITGTNPDSYRDYMIEQKLPDVVELFGQKATALNEIIAKLIEITGGKSNYTAILEKIVLQMDRLYKKPYDIQTEVTALYNNLSSLGTWVSDIQQVDLTMDYFIISGTDGVLPKADAGFFGKLGHEFTSFIASFYEDYSLIGDVQKEIKTIDVWMSGGRDQSLILKQMIDSDFTPSTGIGVNLKLVQVSLLSAVIAGIAPDVSIGHGDGDVVNFAIRGALYDLSSFEDFDTTREWFIPTAYTPMTLEGKVYGIPTSANFEMLFYREDILEELGLEIPETWNDVYSILPVLQRNNMEFGLAADVGLGGTYAMLLYQNGGTYFDEEGTRAVFDNEIGIKTMEQWSEFYSNYGFPLSYDFMNRFRSGEMPIAIADYTAYNSLSIFAPQIRNLWSWGLVPGMEKEDGTIDRSVMVTQSCALMLAAAKDPEASWEFLKWYAGADAMVTYAREIESLLGVSGRAAPANLEALAKIPWSSAAYQRLSEQLSWGKTIPQIPGSYYVTRYLQNAFRTSINTNKEVRELLVEYTKIVNKEITKKRKEFGMTVYEENN